VFKDWWDLAEQQLHGGTLSREDATRRPGCAGLPLSEAAQRAMRIWWSRPSARTQSPVTKGFVLRGIADEALLETYEQERRVRGDI